MHLDLNVRGDSGELDHIGDGPISLGWSGSAIAVEVPGSGGGSRVGTASSTASGSTIREKFSPRCTSRTKTAVLQSSDDGFTSGMVSAVVDRSQPPLSRDLHPLLLKLRGLESDCAGVLGGRLLPL